MIRGQGGLALLLTHTLFLCTYLINSIQVVESFTPSSSSSSALSVAVINPTKHYLTHHPILTPATSTSTARLPRLSLLHRTTSNKHPTKHTTTSTTIKLSDWSGFEALEDDDDFSDNALDGPDGGFADENDDPERKAAVGNTLPSPEVYWDGEPLFLPQGECVPLTEDNVQALLAACRIEIGTMFGYTAENRGVGITGGVDYVEMDGPMVVVTLKGRFWHQRPTVLARVGAYIMGRIPEVVDVIVYDEYELSDEVNNAAA